MGDEVRAAIAVTLDPVTTVLAVRGGAGEAHPLWGWLIAVAGLAPAMVVRGLAGLVLVGALAVAVRSELTPLTAWTLRAVAGVFAGIVAWNVIVWVSA